MKRTNKKKLELKPQMIRMLVRPLGAKELANVVGGETDDPGGDSHSMVPGCSMGCGGTSAPTHA